MTDQKKTTTRGNLDVDGETPLDLRGTQQHFDLNNQPGEAGDPDHVASGDVSSEEVAEIVSDAVAKSDEDTLMAAALSDAVKK